MNLPRAGLIAVSEEQRQLLLLALAYLAVERPGFDPALSEIAALMDTGTEMFTLFKKLRTATKKRLTQ